VASHASLVINIVAPVACRKRPFRNDVLSLSAPDWSDRVPTNEKSSVTIAGKFDKWDGTLTFQSPDETTGALELKIDAASVDTGSGMKNGKLKSKDFFDVEQNPYITFRSTKFVPKGPHTYEVDGDFTIRGVSNPEKLSLTLSGKGAGSGEIHGAMVFNRKDYGMNKGIPFIKIADHVDVNFHLKWKHVAGPQLAKAAVLSHGIMMCMSGPVSRYSFGY
jgi:polyisoprenoid-binding protein YceI